MKNSSASAISGLEAGTAYQLSVIIPTYNEAQNIAALIRQCRETLDRNGLKGEIVVVDDDSPDGTGRICRDLMKADPHLKLVERRGQKGLSSAVLEGFRNAGSDVWVVMDADFSHPPQKIPHLAAPVLSHEAQLVVGSRYVPGGKIFDWPLSRRMISKLAAHLGRLVVPVKDPASGFFALRREVLDGLFLNPRGYKIGLEIMARGASGRIKEIPIDFTDRRQGKSKMSLSVAAAYIGQILRLLCGADGHFIPFLRFCAVGCSGLLVNLFVFYALIRWAGWHYLLGAAAAFCAAVTSNFFGNKVWTFRKRAVVSGQSVFSYLKFFLVSSSGLLLNIGLLFGLVHGLSLNKFAAQVAAVGTVSVWNYLWTARWVFEIGRPRRPNFKVEQ